MLSVPLVGLTLLNQAHCQEEPGAAGTPPEQGQGQGRPGGRGQGRRGGPGGGMMGGMASIVGIPEVQAELKLDDGQKESLKTMRDEIMKKMAEGRGPGGGGFGGGGFGGGRFGGEGPSGTPPTPAQIAERQTQMAAMQAQMKKTRMELESKISDILDPDQNSRVLGLMIQREGGRALTSKILTGALELSSEQLAALESAEETISKERASAMQEAMSGGGGGGGGWMKMRELMEAMNKKFEELLLAVLTPEQRTQFDSLKGEKFDFPEPPAGGFGGPGGRGDRPGGRGERPGS